MQGCGHKVTINVPFLTKGPVELYRGTEGIITYSGQSYSKDLAPQIAIVTTGIFTDITFEGKLTVRWSEGAFCRSGGGGGGGGDVVLLVVLVVNVEGWWRWLWVVVVMMVLLMMLVVVAVVVMVAVSLTSPSLWASWPVDGCCGRLGRLGAGDGDGDDYSRRRSSSTAILLLLPLLLLY